MGHDSKYKYKYRIRQLKEEQILALQTKQIYNGYMNVVTHLFQLQQLDHHLDKIESRLAEISALLGKSDILTIAENKKRESHLAMDAAERKLSELEDSTKKQRLKISTDESSLYGGRIHNPKELQDLQTEIASLRKHLAELEDDQLDAMISFEAAAENVRLADAAFSLAQAEDIELKSALRGESAAHLKQKDLLLAEREAAARSISPDLMSVYLQLRKQKRGTAVALAREGGCSACGATLRPAEIQAAKSSSQITYCSSCGRILYMG